MRRTVDMMRTSDLAAKIHRKVANVVGAADVARADSQSTQMLLANSATGKHLYQGTVPVAVVKKRRAKNKAARVARRANRR